MAVTPDCAEIASGLLKAKAGEDVPEAENVPAFPVPPAAAMLIANRDFFNIIMFPFKLHVTKQKA
jgi:hypothetical protein